MLHFFGKCDSNGSYFAIQYGVFGAKMSAKYRVIKKMALELLVDISYLEGLNEHGGFHQELLE